MADIPVLHPPAVPLPTLPSTARSWASEAVLYVKSGCWTVTACGAGCPPGGEAPDLPQAAHTPALPAWSSQGRAWGC